MKTVASVCILLVGLSACATGSTPDESLLDAGSTTDDDSGTPVFVHDGTDAGAMVTTTSGVTVPTSNTASTSDDAGAPTGNTALPTDDAGFEGPGGYDAGGEGFDAGLGDLGFDAGDDDGFDAGSHSGHGHDGDDAGGSSETCDGYASPDTPAECECTAEHQSECQQNGCYGGYYCDTHDFVCKESAPEGC